MEYGQIVIVKFFGNVNQDNSSKLITRTLGKVAFIVKGYKGELPKGDEFWKCRLVEEINPGQRKGCFLIEPLEQVQQSSINRLIPGLYSEKIDNGILYIKPNHAGNYILPLSHKKNIENVYAIIVDLEK